MHKDLNNHPSRRTFVKDTSLIAGGIMAMPMLSKANFFSGADDVIKVAVIGCGGRGTGAAMQAISSKQNVKIVAMADAFKDNVDNCHKALTKEINEGVVISVKNWMCLKSADSLALMHTKKQLH